MLNFYSIISGVRFRVWAFSLWFLWKLFLYLAKKFGVSDSIGMLWVSYLNYELFGTSLIWFHGFVVWSFFVKKLIFLKKKLATFARPYNAIFQFHVFRCINIMTLCKLLTNFNILWNFLSNSILIWIKTTSQIRLKLLSLLIFIYLNCR